MKSILGRVPPPSHANIIRPDPVLPATAIIIPAHNEVDTVGAVVAAARQLPGALVIVVDDLSSDATAAAARQAGAVVLPLRLQLGAWGATQTGLRYALGCGCRQAVTLDADGQHEPALLGQLLAPLNADTADVVIGAFPERASHARRLAWHYFRWLTGLRVHDITSGFRAYNASAMHRLAAPEASLLDYQDVGVLLIARRRGLRIVEVAVPMRARACGASRIFSSWWTVGRYMIETTVLCLARVGHGRAPNRDNEQEPS